MRFGRSELDLFGFGKLVFLRKTGIGDFLKVFLEGDRCFLVGNGDFGGWLNSGMSLCFCVSDWCIRS